MIIVLQDIGVLPSVAVFDKVDLPKHLFPDVAVH